MLFMLNKLELDLVSRSKLHSLNYMNLTMRSNRTEKSCAKGPLLEPQRKMKGGESLCLGSQLQRKEDGRVGLYSHKTINYPPLTSPWIHSQSCLNCICIFSHLNWGKNGKLDKNGTVGYAFPMIMRPHVALSILNLLNHQVSESCYCRNSQRTPESAGVYNNRNTSPITAAATAPRETLQKKSFFICITLLHFL